ncbi:MAG: hypothetical protein WCP30_00735 [Mycobacteriaceae bacterium]
MSTDHIDQGDINDVEKRWHDPAMVRAAVKYVLLVIALAAAAFTVAVVWRSVIAGILVPAILFSGGIGAFVQTYRVWRAQGVWPIWQGAGWFLLMLFLVCLSVPFAVAA